MDALDAKVCVVQCPPSFRCTRENISSLQKFLGKLDRGKACIAWGPRGDWKQYPDEVKRLCGELDLIHCVDPFVGDPLHVGNEGIAYFRLHGSPPGKQMYRYKYTKGDCFS
jgi:uncharacterized protein YecE (DUF72 family)